MKWLFAVGLLMALLVGYAVLPKGRIEAETRSQSAVDTRPPAAVGTTGAHADVPEPNLDGVITDIETITGAVDGMVLIGRRVDLHVDVQNRASHSAFWVGSPDNRLLVVLDPGERGGHRHGAHGGYAGHRIVPVRRGQRATISGVIRTVPKADQRAAWRLTRSEDAELADRKIYVRADSVSSEGHGRYSSSDR